MTDYKSATINLSGIGSWLTLAHPAVAEIMARSGFRWLVVDTEHGALSNRDVEDMVRIIDLCDVMPVVRVAKNLDFLIKHAMDVGAHGVMVPMVNNRDDAIAAVNSVKYSPVGQRGMGLARAQRYGERLSEYIEWVRNDPLIIVQIEHVDGVNNLDDILGVDGVSAVFVGPYDLSASLGCPGDFTNRNFVNAVSEISTKCQASKTPLGIHVVEPDSNRVATLLQTGYSFVAHGLDTVLFQGACRASASNLI